MEMKIGNNKKWCKASDPAALPVKKPRRTTIDLEENCGWSVQRGRVLLETSVGPRGRGLWRLPVIKAPASRAPLHESHYPFTHHRVHLRVFPTARPDHVQKNQCWIEFARLTETAMTAPHRRALTSLLDLEAGRPKLRRP